MVCIFHLYGCLVEIANPFFKNSALESQPVTTLSYGTN